MLRHNHPEISGATYVVFADAQRRYTDFTDEVCTLLGYSRKDLLQKSVDDVSFKMDNVSQVFDRFLQHGKMEGDYVLRHKDGAAIPIRFRALTFPDGCNAAIWTPIKDWREPYLAALIETNPAKLTRKVEVAMSAIDRAGHGASAAEQQALRDARSALGVLSRGTGR
ncbi:MAG: PAS domain-containing protein [Acidobacteria bacterium]|nr:PAS domain-containing protein [Acidobacteriota bacterium]